MFVGNAGKIYLFVKITKNSAVYQRKTKNYFKIFKNRKIAELTWPGTNVISRINNWSTSYVSWTSSGSQRDRKCPFPHLIKDGFFRTDETPPERLFSTIVVDDWQTNVEQLAIIFYISIVTVFASITTEGITDVQSYAGCVAWKS